MFESMFFPPTWVSGLSFETMHESLPIHLTSLTRSANIMEPCPRNGYGNLMKSGYSGEAELDLPTIVGFDPLSRPHMMFCSKFEALNHGALNHLWDPAVQNLPPTRSPKWFQWIQCGQQIMGKA